MASGASSPAAAAVIEIRAGDTIHTPPGEWHWHGAAPDRFMTHLAIWEAPAEGPESEWGDLVTDAEYLAAADRTEAAMTAWAADDLARIDGRDEIDVASTRTDGSLRPFVTVWFARIGDDLYVRSAHGPENTWFRRALASGEGRIRGRGIERDVDFEVPGPASTTRSDASYHAKYDRYGLGMVRTVVSPDATRSTLRLVPR